MIEYKQINLRHHKIHTNQVSKSLSFRKERPFNSPLPKFFNWLKRRIYSGDKRFALGVQDFILYKPSKSSEELIFILPEVFEQYYRHSGVSKNLVQSELKKKLKITFSYTIVRDEKMIEVFPCTKFFKGYSAPAPLNPNA